jgi:taurine dioxygenase
VRATGYFGEIGPLSRPPKLFPKGFAKLLPNIMMISNIRENGETIGALPDGEMNFHHDMIHHEMPHNGTLLYSVEIPSHGGDTLFASGYAAYAALPARLQQRLEGRNGAFTYGGRRKHTALLNPEDRDWTPVWHPIIRTHPETGRKSLYFDPGKIVAIEGVDPAESDALIDELTGYMIQPDAEYRHKWRVGDIVIWDNRCSYHKAAGDYPPHEDRIHWRVSIKDYAAEGRLAAE